MYGTDGTYALTLTSLATGAQLLSVSSSSIDMWRTGTTFVRPKWGIYRSLHQPEYLRDEVVLFADFCLAKGSDTCPGTSYASPVRVRRGPAPGPARVPRPTPMKH
jgi:hypothetical protein